MRFKKPKDAVAWAYEYCHAARSARGIDHSRILDEEEPITRHEYNHARHALAIRILAPVGGYIPPAQAENTILAFYIGWVRWKSMTAKERKLIKKTNRKIKHLMEDEGIT